MKKELNIYSAPQVESMELIAECVICASEEIDVTNPWEGNTEIDL